jgi:adenine phosphoribosyltransferase
MSSKRRADGDLRALIRDVRDYPRPGIVFKDITPLLADPRAFAEVIDRLAARIEPPEAVVAIESRGFILGAALALHWRRPFIPARKFGKLPGATVRQTYQLEYGEDTLELQADALTAGRRVVIVDDLLATGGTAHAVAQLVERMGAEVVTLLFLVELVGLGGREKLARWPVEALLALE